MDKASYPGREFEADVKQLLHLQGWTVRDEQLLGPKKIDIYAEKSVYFGHTKRLAVECKDYSRRLTHQDIRLVYSDYRPLLDNSMIDEVLLVSRLGATPSALAFSRDCRGFIHISYVELLNSLLDFSGYLRALISQFRQAGLSEYYIPQRFSLCAAGNPCDRDVERELLSWIASDSIDAKPIALLAGYGMGKTTLALRLASLLAERHSANPDSRIPILIRLEEISTESSLEGLIGKHLTSSAPVAGYNFSTFMELNARGRFVIFLDAFDEMKQAMSKDVMRYNFGQLNRLVVPNSRVVLGGRPSVFLDEEEYLEALHGKRRVFGKLKKIPGWPDYRELYLVPFSNEEIRRFIRCYLHFRVKSTDSSQDRYEKLVHQLASGGSAQIAELAGRPVQLRMLIEILPTWEGELDELTLTTLYSEFIDLMIRREMAKQTRQTFSAVQRREFARQLAWWMWAKGLMAVTFSKIAFKVCAKWLESEDESQLDGIKRDLLSACFLEVKQPDGYFFPHRSFQEFLVAEKLRELLLEGLFAEVSSEEVDVNPEIQTFLGLQLGIADLKLLKSKLWMYRGVVSNWVVDVVLRLTENPSELLAELERKVSPWALTLLAIGLLRGQWDISAERKIELAKAMLAAEGLGPAQRVQFAQLQVVVIVLLQRLFETLKIDYKGHLIQLLRTARTEQLFGETAKKIEAAALFARHRDKQYCCLQSWIDGSCKPEGAIRLRTQPPDTLIREHGKRKKAMKTPHRMLGVTPKKDWQTE